FSLPVQWFETAFILPRAHARQQLFYDAFVQRVRASKCFPCGQRHFAAGDATDSRLRYRYLAPTHDQLPLVVSIPIGLTLDLLLLLWSAELLSIVFEQCLQHLHARRHDKFPKAVLQSHDHFHQRQYALLDESRGWSFRQSRLSGRMLRHGGSPFLATRSSIGWRTTVNHSTDRGTTPPFFYTRIVRDLWTMRSVYSRGRRAALPDVDVRFLQHDA